MKTSILDEYWAPQVNRIGFLARLSPLWPQGIDNFQLLYRTVHPQSKPIHATEQAQMREKCDEPVINLEVASSVRKGPQPSESGNPTVAVTKAYSSTVQHLANIS